MRGEFAKLCLETVKNDSKSVVMVGDISHFLLRETEQVAPDRFYNIGICEQSMVGMASGMAIEGMRPIIHTIAPFLVERAYEQIKNDIGYQNTEVTIVTVGGTYDYSDLGCTHHCYGDIAMMRFQTCRYLSHQHHKNSELCLKKLGVMDYLNISDCPKNNTHRILM